METWKETLIDGATDADIARKVACAIDELLGRERILILIGGHEQAITHRLAVYLDPLFPSWHVDCEYNRESEHAKRNSQGKRVVPDVIVHRRMTDENLLVIEVKMGASEQVVEGQINRLRDYRSIQGYRHSLFLDVKSILNDLDGAVEWVGESDSA